MASRPHLLPPPPYVVIGNIYFVISLVNLVFVPIFSSIGLFWWRHRPHPCSTPSLSLGTFIFLIYISKLIFVPIFSLIRTFWNFRWRRRRSVTSQSIRRSRSILTERVNAFQRITAFASLHAWLNLSSSSSLKVQIYCNGIKIKISYPCKQHTWSYPITPNRGAPG